MDWKHFAELSATPIDIPVEFATDGSDRDWNTSAVDRLLRWTGSAWRPRERWDCGLGGTVRFSSALADHAIVHAGRLLAIHPDGYGLVMLRTRTLAMIALDALRVADAASEAEPG